MNTVALAQEAGANVNLTWWEGPYPAEEQKRRTVMDDFAAIVEEARRRGHRCITHLTIQNEVNGEHVDIGGAGDTQQSMELYNLLYRDLDAALRARADPLKPSETMRDAVQLVGGDLVEQGNSHQDEWLTFMQQQMRDVLDGYSIHVYWTPADYAKFEHRLQHLTEMIGQLKIRKPIYVTEYGVKATNQGEPGTIDGQNPEDLVDTAFEHGWFNALAPQLGCVGLAKWVLYRTEAPASASGA